MCRESSTTGYKEEYFTGHIRVDNVSSLSTDTLNTYLVGFEFINKR